MRLCTLVALGVLCVALARTCTPTAQAGPPSHGTKLGTRLGTQLGTVFGARSSAAEADAGVD